MLQYSQLDSVLAAVVLAAEELEAGWAEWEVLVGDTDCSSTQVTTHVSSTPSTLEG